MSLDRKSGGGDGPNVRALAALKARAMLKLWSVTIVLTELLSAIFSSAVDFLDPGAASMPTLVFTCATSALVSRWLVMDAARAWAHASERGYVLRGDKNGQMTVEVTQDCPKRWLVVLHAGLNPTVAIKG